MSGGESSSVPIKRVDHYGTARLDYSADFELWFERGDYVFSAIEVENQNPGIIEVVNQGVSPARFGVRVLVRALTVGVAELILRAKTASGQEYPVKLEITVVSL